MIPAWPDRMSGGVVFAYVRHRPEQTLLYQHIECHWPEFHSHLREAGRYLPRHVTREFDEYLGCGRLEHGFVRVRCEDCRHEHLVAFSWPLLRILRPRHLCIHAHHHVAGSALVAVQGAWWKPPHCQWMRSCPTDPDANGYSAFRIHCDSRWPTSHWSWVECWALLTERSQRT